MYDILPVNYCALKKKKNGGHKFSTNGWQNLKFRFLNIFCTIENDLSTSVPEVIGAYFIIVVML